jgi:bacillithiol biosynthesis cysteine-adding enzyme BshC
VTRFDAISPVVYNQYVILFNLIGGKVPLNVISVQEPVQETLSDRYRRQDPQVVSLFGAHPSSQEDWQKRSAWLDRTAGERADRDGLVRALRNYQDLTRAHPAVFRSLDRLARQDALVVVGGQQAGLFGGALMIYYKALTVIQTARHAERLLGRPVVPVFWIAGEDHDFDEANHVHVQGADGGVKRIRIERPPGARLAVSRTPISAADWDAALADLAVTLPDTAFKSEMLASLRRQTADAPTLSLAFARLLAEWFGPDGLVLLDADDPALRALEGSMFRKLIARNDELEQALRQGERAVASLGLPLQAEAEPGNANIFLHHDSGRLLLFKDGGKFVDRRGIVAAEREELLEWTESSPERLSTNALTRPLMQDYLLPVLAAVLGPSELAYWGLLGPAFHAFGMQMPVLVPRQSFTYLEPQTLKWMDKFGLTPEEALYRWEQRKTAWLAAQDQWDLDGVFRTAKDQFAAIYAPVMEKVASLDPGLAALSASNRDRILGQIAYLEQRAREALSNRHETSLRQWDRIRISLTPGGKPQERVYGTIQFWNRYGKAWLDIWRDAPFDPTGGHRLVEGLGG